METVVTTPKVGDLGGSGNRDLNLRLCYEIDPMVKGQWAIDTQLLGPSQIKPIERESCNPRHYSWSTFNNHARSC